MLRPIKWIAIGVAVASCVSTVKTPVAGPEWVSNMQRLSQAHLRLMPLADKPSDFADPQNADRIRADLREMAIAAGEIVRDPRSPNTDPLIEFSRARFAIEIRQAAQAFQAHDVEWSRFALRRATGYCISCHTRADRGHEFPLKWQPELAALTPPQRSEFFLANRLYGSALSEVEALAADKDQARTNTAEWAVNLQRALAVLVRVKEDPVTAQRIAHAITANTGAPIYLRRDASAWERDLSAWRKDPAFGAHAELGQAKRLLADAARYGEDMQNAALILNLRASSILHRLLERPRSPDYGQALYLAGVVSQSLSYLNSGLLDQYYYETCIRNQPHSDLAIRCYQNFESSVQKAYPFLQLEPENEWAVQLQLSELKRLASKGKSDSGVFLEPVIQFEKKERGP